MEQKILIADDSLTIQKVIKITLANEPFELHDCAQATNLIENVKSLNPAMVLLDFNLSENKTGYDLCREIKAINPQIQVLMLFGTFDTIDEALLTDCGCSYHIVKPFDGTKFINLCRAMAAEFENNSSSELDQDADFSLEEHSEEEIPEEIEIEDSTSDEDEWVVNQPAYEEAPIEEAPGEKFQNLLEQGVEDWGMEVPSIIGKEETSSSIEIPEVIASTELGEDSALPSSSDLEYPEISAKSTESQEPKSKLIPLEELNIGDEINFASSDEVNVIEGGTDTDEAVKNLENQIRDEIDEEQDLWAADIVEPADKEEPAKTQSFTTAADSFDSIELEDLPQVKPHKLSEVVDHFQESTPSDFPADVMDEPAINSIDLEELSQNIRNELEKELTEKLSPLVEKFVKDYCRNQIEKVAWEVIPDLAENLIKKEIQKISDSLMDQ